MSATAPVTNAPPALWAAARALIATIFNLFGDPARIAFQHTHTGAQRALLLKWLRAGEALVRHLLLIEAASIAKPNTRPLLHASRKLMGRARVRRMMSFDADNPEDWRVSFRCLARAPKPAQLRETWTVRRAPHHISREDRWSGEFQKRVSFHSAWPLAERAEALLRVFNDPEPYARRLAARLHATPHRAAALTRHPDTLPDMVDDFPVFQRDADAARRRFESS